MTRRPLELFGRIFDQIGKKIEFGKERVTASKKRQVDVPITVDIEKTDDIKIERELVQDFSSISAERQRLYEGIHAQMKELITDGEAGLVLTAAMGPSVKDILLTTPLKDGAQIIVYDEGSFISSKPQSEDDNNEKIRQTYLKNYSSDFRGSNFFRTNLFDVLDGYGFGKKDLMMWELEDLGVDMSTVQVEQRDGEDVWDVTFNYSGKDVSLFFVQGRTSDYKEKGTSVNKIVEQAGIDVVVARGADGAFSDNGFSSFVLDNIKDQAILLTDQTGTLREGARQRVPVSDDINSTLKENDVVFGYSTSNDDIYRMSDSVSVGIYRYTKK